MKRQAGLQDAHKGWLFRRALRLHTSLMKVGRSIVLTGFMGAGKSSISYHLEKLTGLPRYDTDHIISAKFGLPISEAFQQLGGERFRAEETEALRNLSPAATSIIVTGGGTILRDENVLLLKRLGIVVLLEADEETLWRRIADREDRPLLQTANPRATFLELLRKRKPLYESAADVRIDTSALSLEDAADLILKRIDSFAFETR